MPDLESLRQKILDIDREIIRLIGARLEVTRKIGREKAESGIPLRNWKVEKEVIAHAQKEAEMLNIDVQFIKAVMQILIRESWIQQEKLHYSRYRGNKERILVVGGLGAMGRWLVRFFQNQGHRVYIYDTKGSSDDFDCFDSLEKGLEKVGYAIIATPLDTVARVIREITKLNFSGIVFDIASLKGHLIDAIEDARTRGIRITSIHPMFGPDCRSLADKVVCLCDCGVHTANQKIEEMFKDTAVSLVRLSLREHDYIISYVLGLSHLINIIFMNVLIRGGEYKDFKRVGSTTFFSQLKTTRSVIDEDPRLYYAIQQLNPFKDELYNRLRSAVDTITNIVLNKDEKRFIEIMEQAREWFKR
ncbi:hypothetical protein BXT86_00400 [candidate division WOR-3 bacterium 4484_100]|uniref:Chorismate mutase n=1 Tax=candidate division WOR-3 bacterium 4484_100 TaxID=1936077 RepID=A0A1V4QGV8_UNCW3|nr:MAG: hypothetical protein BXT86_00400 [candidate division WOR-3 bacterium 4484_100]